MSNMVKLCTARKWFVPRSTRVCSPMPARKGCTYDWSAFSNEIERPVDYSMQKLVFCLIVDQMLRWSICSLSNFATEIDKYNHFLLLSDLLAFCHFFNFTSYVRKNCVPLYFINIFVSSRKYYIQKYITQLFILFHAETYSFQRRSHSTKTMQSWRHKL